RYFKIIGGFPPEPPVKSRDTWVFSAIPKRLWAFREALNLEFFIPKNLPPSGDPSELDRKLVNLGPDKIRDFAW
ncbi:hypothetical protein M1O18_06750, partial [Dehalococcoidia bacterium]|nr:hypothetical protein [Dehalococcoidia bacterium]